MLNVNGIIMWKVWYDLVKILLLYAMKMNVQLVYFADDYDWAREVQSGTAAEDRPLHEILSAFNVGTNINKAEHGIWLRLTNLSLNCWLLLRLALLPFISLSQCYGKLNAY